MNWLGRMMARCQAPDILAVVLIGLLLHLIEGGVDLFIAHHGHQDFGFVYLHWLDSK